jgi:hypothetical protein
MKILLTPRGALRWPLAEAIDLFRGGRVPTMVARDYGLPPSIRRLQEQIDRLAETTKGSRVFRAQMCYRLISSP